MYLMSVNSPQPVKPIDLKEVMKGKETIPQPQTFTEKTPCSKHGLMHYVL